MPAKTDLSALNCSLARALDAVGDWWTLLILRDAFLGLTRFGEFHDSLGIARNTLTARLQALTDAGIFAVEGSAARPHYVLTQKGRELFPALVALLQWGDKWESGGKPPLIVADGSGTPVAPVAVKSQSGRRLDPADAHFAAGPGANARTRAFLAMRKGR